MHGLGLVFVVSAFWSALIMRFMRRRIRTLRVRKIRVRTISCRHRLIVRLIHVPEIPRIRLTELSVAPFGPDPERNSQRVPAALPIRIVSMAEIPFVNVPAILLLVWR